MREECKHFQSRTYASGEVARFCVLDLAPEAPWRCPDNCPRYERRLADVGWVHGTPRASRGSRTSRTLPVEQMPPSAPARPRTIVNESPPGSWPTARARRPANDARANRRRWFRRTGLSRTAPGRGAGVTLRKVEHCTPSRLTPPPRLGGPRLARRRAARRPSSASACSRSADGRERGVAVLAHRAPRPRRPTRPAWRPRRPARRREARALAERPRAAGAASSCATAGLSPSSAPGCPSPSRSAGPAGDWRRRALGQVVASSDDLRVAERRLRARRRVLDVPARTASGRPIVVVHWCDAGAPDGRRRRRRFPRTVVAARRGRRGGGDRGAGRPGRRPVASSCRSAEISVGDGAQLSYVCVQDLGPGRLAHRALGRPSGATRRCGASRSASGATTTAAGPTRRRSARAARPSCGRLPRLGRPRSTTCARSRTTRRPRTDQRPAVQGGRRRAVPLDLQRPHPGPHGAVRADAMQTNHNLVLDETAHADSVPNLDIEENDVRCSHASTSARSTRTSATTSSRGGVPPSGPSG